MLGKPADTHQVSWEAMRRSDVEDLSGLLTAIELFDEPSERHSIDELYESFDEMDSNPDRDALLGRDTGGTLVAYAWNHRSHADVDPRRVLVTGGVHPGWRRRGIGHALLGWQLDEARDWYRDTFENPFGPLQVNCYVDHKLAAQRELYEQLGLQAVRWYADMSYFFSQPIPDLAAPSGVRLVPMNAKYSEAVRRAHNEAFQDHWGSQPVDVTRWREQLRRSASRLSWSWVALDGATSEVVGYALNSAYEQDWKAQGFSEGWTERLGVRPAWRGRGIAKGLLVASMRSFSEAGLDAAGLGVDSDSPTGAFHLYEQMGYRSTNMVVMYSRTEEHLTKG